jgi:uncharacterized membrane protein YciS (DUF1049 family)
MKKLLLVLAILALICVSFVVAQEESEYDNVAEVDDALDLDNVGEYDMLNFKRWTRTKEDAPETPETPESELDEADLTISEADPTINEEAEAEVDDALDLDQVEDNEAEVDSALNADVELEGHTDLKADAAIASERAKEQSSSSSHSDFRHWNLSLFAVIFITFGIVVGLSTVGYVIYKYRSKVKKQQKQLEREQQGALNTLTAEHVDQPYVLHVL